MLRICSIALLLTGACAAGFAAADPGLLALAPANSRIVAAVDVDGSRNSPFGQFLLRQLSAHETDFQQLLELTGFDPRRDLQSLVLAAAPSQDSKAQGRFAVLARGNFDQGRIKDAAQKNGSVVQRFQGIDLMVDSKGHGQTAFAFPDVNLAVMGDLLSVQQVIQNQSHSAGLDPALQDQISAIETNDAWFASIVPASSLAMNLNPETGQLPNQAQVLQSITRSSGGINFNSASDVVFNADTRSAQDAAALADVIRFLAGMAQTQSGKDGQATPLAAALSAMKLDVAGTSVHLALHLPESVLEQLAAMQQQNKPARATR